MGTQRQMGLIQRMFGRKADPATAMQPLYDQVVARAREPHWYEAGAVPDTMDGRFDMIAALLSLVLLRLEPEEEARQESVWLTELFGVTPEVLGHCRDQVRHDRRWNDDPRRHAVGPIQADKKIHDELVRTLQHNRARTEDTCRHVVWNAGTEALMTDLLGESAGILGRIRAFALTVWIQWIEFAHRFTFSVAD